MLAIGAFLGWGRAIYQRYKPFVPTTFASKLDLHADIRAIRKELGEEPGNWGSSSTRGSSGPHGFERDYRYSFPLDGANAIAFLDKLRQRFRDQLDAAGCGVHGTGRGTSGGMQEFRFWYVRDVVEGSVRGILIPDGDEARLFVFVDERRKSP
jgi:hypothetical protein